MIWDKPEMVEIKMDAEISSYEDDGNDPRKDWPPFTELDAPRDAEPEAPRQRA